MSVYQGYDGNLTLTSGSVAETSKWSLTINNETFDRKVFGSSGWRESTVVGKSWDASAEGYLDLSDTEQLSFYNTVVSGTTLSTYRFYINDTHYFSPDTVTDADACGIIENWTAEADASGQITYSISIKGSGPICYT